MSNVCFHNIIKSIYTYKQNNVTVVLVFIEKQRLICLFTSVNKPCCLKSLCRYMFFMICFAVSVICVEMINERFTVIIVNYLKSDQSLLYALAQYR